MAVKIDFVVFGLLCHVVWWLDTNVSEDCAASILRVHFNPEDGGSNPENYKFYNFR
jgi:hypothetical protein